jgi:putative hemolysin
VPSHGPDLTRGRYTARLATTQAEIAAAQALRHLTFRTPTGRAQDQRRLDADRFDSVCSHLLITETATGRLVCCCRILPLPQGAIGQSYSAQFYDLERLVRFRGPMLELGRFCLHPDWHDPDILRLAWAALTRLVDDSGTELLFGCSSFPGTDPLPHGPALAQLAAHHLAPPDWAPVARGIDTVDLRRMSALPDARGIPPLLQTYLAMGAWVSDHAVIDRDLGTLHVLTGLQIASVPAARARALRALAG